MMKQNACFKGDGGSYIDLLITNSKFSFMKTNSFETGLSDDHHIIYTTLEIKFEKFKPKKSIYRNFKQYDGGQLNWIFSVLCLCYDPVDTGRKLKVHKTFRRRPGHLLNILRVFNLRPLSAGKSPCSL